MTSYQSWVTGCYDRDKLNRLLSEGKYAEAINIYEQAIRAEPDVKSYYWQLGLILLLQGQEIEAQTTWLLGMTDGSPEEIELWTEELCQVLDIEADKRKEAGEYALARAIRQHIKEINPSKANNLLHLLGLSTLLEVYTGDEPVELDVIELLRSENNPPLDLELLKLVLTSVLYKKPYHSSSFDLAEASLARAEDVSPFIEIIKTFVNEIAYSTKQFPTAVSFMELCLRFYPKDANILYSLSSFYQDSYEYSKGIEVAKLCYSAMENVVGKINANFMIMRALMSAGGNWDEFCDAMDRHKDLLNSFFEQHREITDNSEVISPSINCIFFFPYYQDRLAENMKLRSRVARRYQLKVQNSVKEQVEKLHGRYSPPSKINKSSQRLKIGYISHCLRSHSVGWLARWLFQYHNRDKFEICTYLLHSDPSRNPVQEWYISKSDKAHRLRMSEIEAADKIYEDEVDLLIDLDSVTMTTTCATMSLKAAPIQVTWLGWDASGIPAIDYFIADPYVLPDNAEEHYPHKIWRLPHTYVAVDGFELAVPSLRRQDLDIPEDAVIYFSGQKGYKYNPNTVRLQMQIIKEVPKSYFLIKGTADRESIENFFIKIAEEEGVKRDRMRFLPMAPSETEHRANLGIVDVVLDTYPYNGATTTMETLWMCIPIVTRVGEQFAARNSYTMMINAGITEGIAWTDEEYVEWGIKLGRDEKMRQEISWKLRKSKQTAPLWNGKQFTREMEKAYEGMWQRYIEGGSR